MELTPEERQRIYEEEKARAEARARIESEQMKQQEDLRKQATAQRAAYVKTHRKKIIVIGCVSIVVLLCVYSVYYVTRYGPDSDYRSGFRFGGAYYLKVAAESAHCLTLQMEALQRGRSGAFIPPDCETSPLDGDSAMEEAAMRSRVFSGMGEDEREGFRDGWRAERRKDRARDGRSN